MTLGRPTADDTCKAIIKSGVECRPAPIRSSAWETFRACPRRFLWKERFGLRPAGEYVTSLRVGDFTHRILTACYAGKTLAEGIGEALGHHNVALSEILTVAVDRGGMLPGGRDPNAIIQQMSADFELAVLIAQTLWTHYPPDLGEWEIVPELIEVLIEAMAPGLGLKSRILGRIDVPLRNKVNGDLGFLDFKTCDPKIPTRNRARALRWDLQPQIYRLLRRHADNSLSPVTHVFHVIIQKPNLRIAATDRKTSRENPLKFPTPFDAWIERCRTDFYEKRFAEARDLEKLGKPGSPPILISKVRFEPWSQETTNQLRELDRASTRAPRLDDFYRDRRSCYEYNRPCALLDLCEHHPQTLPGRVKANYIQRFREDEETSK